MYEYLHTRLRGGLPPDTTKLPLLAPLLNAAEAALTKLRWEYDRIYFEETRYYMPEGGRANVEAWLDVYRNAGIEERYFSVTPMENAPVWRYTVTNRDHVPDSAQERIVREFCRTKAGRRITVVYPIPAIPDEPNVRECGIRCVHGGMRVTVSTDGGWDRGIARRVSAIFADAVGMKVGRVYKNTQFF